jgi:hypothetical protein
VGCFHNPEAAMKVALLFYHSVYDDEIREMLEGLGCVRFVEVPRAWAQDQTDRRFGTHVYPGTDSVILAFVEGECTERLKNAVHTFRSARARENTHLALLPVEEFV